jgi:DNA mismatch repair ATPase MutL
MLLKKKFYDLDLAKGTRYNGVLVTAASTCLKVLKEEARQGRLFGPRDISGVYLNLPVQVASTDEDEFDNRSRAKLASAFPEVLQTPTKEKKSSRQIASLRRSAAVSQDVATQRKKLEKELLGRNMQSGSGDQPTNARPGSLRGKSVIPAGKPSSVLHGTVQLITCKYDIEVLSYHATD